MLRGRQFWRLAATKGIAEDCLLRIDPDDEQRAEWRARKAKLRALAEAELERAKRDALAARRRVLDKWGHR